MIYKSDSGTILDETDQVPKELNASVLNHPELDQLCFFNVTSVQDTYKEDFRRLQKKSDMDFLHISSTSIMATTYCRRTHAKQA